MNLALVDQIAGAVLYEGYLLYPYRPSSAKNRQRWTFGGVYPQAYSLAQGGTDSWFVQTQCLVESAGARSTKPTLDARVRFLHLMARQVGELAHPLADLPAGAELAFRPVEALRVGGQVFWTWQEAVEREVAPPSVDLEDLVAQPQQLSFSFPPQRELELLRGPAGVGEGRQPPVIGVLVREQQPIDGVVELAAERAGDQVFKVTIRIANRTPLQEAGQYSRDEALLRSFVSTHTILGVRGGEFVSLLDPPEPLCAAAAGCENIGAWPILVGEAGARNMMLASPIILYDYPQIAPESPGDLFDGTEIDEILTLRIMAMTEEEKREMRSVDPQARALLERTEALAREQLLGLHGAVRSLRRLEQKP